MLKTKPQPQSQPEMDESLERLTKQVAKGGGIAFVGSTIVEVATFGLHILLGRVLGPGAYGLLMGEG